MNWTAGRLAVAAGVVVVAVSGILGFTYLIMNSGGTGFIEIVLDENKAVRVNVTDDGKVHYVDMLNKIMTDKAEGVHETALAILESQHNLYKFGTPTLVDRIGRLKPDAEPDAEYASEFVRLLAQRRGPFEGSTYYDLDDPKTADAIRALDYHDSLAQALRRENLKGELKILWPEEQQVTLLFSDKIPLRKAAACKKSEFYRNKVQLVNIDQGNAIAIEVSARHPLPRPEDCDDDPNKILQVSIVDGKKLFPDTKLNVKEIVWAKAEPPGRTTVPVPPDMLADARPR